MSKLPILIHRFFTKYDTHPKTKEPRALDMVEFGPIGAAGRTHCVERIDLLSSAPADPGANPGMQAAKALWEFIRPRYEAWKNNQELPQTGTPLAAWNHLTPEQAEILRVNGVRSVEDVSVLTDAAFQRIPIAGLRSITEAAKKFLAHQDVNRAVADSVAKDETIAALTARLEEMASMVAKLQEEKETEDAPKRRGRPPKSVEEAA